MSPVAFRRRRRYQRINPNLRFFQTISGVNQKTFQGLARAK